MDIEIGKYYVNKTWKYLMPCLKEYGPVFSAKVNTLYKLAAGIEDGLYLIPKQPSIFLLIDRKYKLKVTENIMQWLKYQPQTIANYPFEVEEGGRKHMFVIEIPPKYHFAYDRFIAGKYSEMYTKQDIASIFRDNPNAKALEVINKTPEARKKFIENIHKSFVIPYEDIDLPLDAELDFPIQKKKEMFNYQFVTI